MPCYADPLAPVASTIRNTAPIQSKHPSLPAITAVLAWGLLR